MANVKSNLAIEGITMHTLSRNSDYLYTIDEDPTYYYTGRNEHGQQALLVLYYPLFIQVLFDESGKLLEIQEHPLPESTRAMIDQNGFTEAFLQGADQAVVNQFRKSGFLPAPITIQRFFFSKYHIGINDFPDCFQDVLHNPSNHSADECSIATSEADRWSREGLFELWLNPGSYRWIERHGQIQAS